MRYNEKITNVGAMHMCTHTNLKDERLHDIDPFSVTTRNQ